VSISRLEQQRTSVQESLILVIMALVTTMIFLSSLSTNGSWPDVLAIGCLSVCLYLLFKEKRLKKREILLLDDLIEKRREVDYLSGELNAGRLELAKRKGHAEDLENRLKEITMLYRAINKVNAEPNNAEVSHTALRAALELVGGDRGSVMLLDEDKQYLGVEASIGIEKAVARATRQKVGEGVAGWVAEFGEPTRITGEAKNDGRFENTSNITGGIRSAVCIPLKLNNETIGVMNLGVSRSGTRDFDEYHISLATIFGEHASVAIMYSRLRRSLDDRDLLLAHRAEPLFLPEFYRDPTFAAGGMDILSPPGDEKAHERNNAGVQVMEGGAVDTTSSSSRSGATSTPCGISHQCRF